MRLNELNALIKETIDKEMNKKDLFERSISKSDAIKNFKNMAEEIVDHILKLFIYQNSPKSHEWKNEIASFVQQSGSFTVKPSNGKLNQSVYFKAMYDYIETAVDMNNKYNVTVSKFKLNAIRQAIKTIEEPIPYHYFLKYVDDIIQTINEISFYLSQNINVIQSEIILILNKNLPYDY